MPYNRKLIDYVPPYYDELLESREILSAEDAEFARLNASIDDLLLQFNVSTATWGIVEWERICGLVSDSTKPLAERRSNVIARLRGYGVVTVEHIKKITDSYYAGETEIIEKPSEYRIVIKFTSEYGVPSGISELQKLLREIIPSHLVLDYDFKFILYRDIVGVTYHALTDLSYAELLVHFTEYRGVSNEVLSGYSNNQLAIYPFAQIERGELSG